jgi:hypothetical protein
MEEINIKIKDPSKPEYIIGIMHTNRQDLLEPLLKVLEGEPYLILDNSDNSDLDIVSLTPTQPLTFAQGMNYFRQKALDFNVDYLITMHEDVIFTEETFKKFKSQINEEIQKKNSNWGIILTNEDSVAAYNIKLLRKLKFDVRLPNYFCDTDFQYWTTQNHFSIGKSILPITHYRSQTILSDNRKLFINNFTYPLYEQYYIQKNGGKRGEEKYLIPFNNILFTAKNNE